MHPKSSIAYFDLYPSDASTVSGSSSSHEVGSPFVAVRLGNRMYLDGGLTNLPIQLLSKA